MDIYHKNGMGSLLIVLSGHECVCETVRETMDSAEQVQVVESCFVAPSEKTPTKGLWLSSFDLVLANRGHTPTVYFYRSDDAGAADFFDVSRLKAAMAKALVAFYPLAGRLAVDDDGRIEINCNGEGALFVVARSELTADDFSDLKPSPELRRLLVPRVEPSSIMMAIQVLHVLTSSPSVLSQKLNFAYLALNLLKNCK